MGIIQRQSIKHSIVTYAGTLIGMVNVLFIYTYALTQVELGLFRTLISAANIVMPLVTLGMGIVAVRYFADFKNKVKQHNGLLFLVLAIPSVGFILFVLITFLFKQPIIDYYSEKPDPELYIRYLPYVYIFVFALMYSKLLSNYISNFQLITVPAIFNDLFIKIAVPSFALFYVWEYISYHNFINAITIAYCLIVAALLVYLWKLGELHLKPNFQIFENKPKVKEMASYAGYGMLGGIGTQVATQIDTFMVGTMIDLGSAGVYTIALFISTVISVPSKSILGITGPIIAASWRKKDTAHIQELYTKTSVNLIAISLLLLIGIWASVDELFSIIPNGEAYAYSKYVILILGVSKIIDVATSVNSHIIGYSDYYRFNLYTVLFLAILNIVTNIILIPIFDLNGVALATLVSMTLYNIAKFIFIKIKFDMQPFTWGSLWILILGAVTYFISQLIPSVGMPFIDIIIKSIVITLIYMTVVIRFNLSEDLTKLFYMVLDKGKAIIKR